MILCEDKYFSCLSKNFISPYLILLVPTVILHSHVYLFFIANKHMLNRDINSLFIFLWCKWLLLFSPLSFHSVLLLFIFFFLHDCYFCWHAPQFWKCFSILFFLAALTEQPMGPSSETLSTPVYHRRMVYLPAFPFSPFFNPPFLAAQRVHGNFALEQPHAPCPFRI